MSTTEIPGAPDDLVRVFVSYAREDRRWLDPDYRFSLIPFLMESLRRHRVVFWFDKELKPGDEFGRLILSQIEQSQIALLIVSQNFLNSEFIENREMPRIAERARLGQMIVVPVLVEPCDWSEYPFLDDRQMVPSSPLIEYTESEPQWAKVRFQILDGLKAQLKRIREAPQSRAQNEQASAPEKVPSASATLAVAPALQMPAAVSETGNALEKNAGLPRQEQEPRASELDLQPKAETVASRGSSREPDTAATEPVPVPVDISKPAQAPTQAASEVSDVSEAAEVPTAVTATAALEPQEVWTQDQTQASAVERKKARVPRRWMFAIAGGATLLIALVVTANYMSHGKPWTVHDSGTAYNLYSIFGTSDGQRLWAVGSFGRIVESDDRGANWTARNSGTGEELDSIFGTSDGKHIWAVGWSGTILESDDGGATWRARSSGTRHDLHSIFGTSDGQHLWAVGENGTILESDDGGATWMARKTGSTEQFDSIFGSRDGKSLWAVGGSGAIVESTDGGVTWAWHKGSNKGLESVFGTIDGKHLWAVGRGGTVLESDDGGTTWMPRNSGTIEDLHSIVGTSDGQRLWAVGFLCVIAESDDGGATWTARKSETTNLLSSIFGTSDGKRLWAVGSYGTILESDR